MGVRLSKEIQLETLLKIMLQNMLVWYDFLAWVAEVREARQEYYQPIFSIPIV